jgi:membrane associated rhomboid family serine protease
MVPAAHSLGRARWTWLALAVLVLVQSYVASAGGFAEWPEIFLCFGVSRDEFLSGRVWQLVTHFFLHGNWSHLFTNAVILLILAARIEDILGRNMLFLSLLCGTVGGGVLHLLLVPPGGLLVGASGACMAMLPLFTTVSPQSRVFFLPVSAGNLGLGVLISSLLLSLLNPLLGLPFLARMGAMAQSFYPDLFQIGHACHFGGSVAGILLARWLMRRRVILADLQRARMNREKH